MLKRLIHTAFPVVSEFHLLLEARLKNACSTADFLIYYHNTISVEQPSFFAKRECDQHNISPNLQEDRTITHMRIPDYCFSRLGYVYVVLAAVLWASSGTAAKFLFQSGVSPVQLVQLRASISAALLLLWLLAGKRSLLKTERKNLVDLFLVGIALAATQFTYLYAISKINVATAILLQYQAPVLIAAHALIFRHRRLCPFTLAALLGSITGCYLMVGGYNLDILNLNRQGIMAGLTSAIAFAFYAVRSEYSMRSNTPWTVVFYALLAAAVIWNVLEPPLAAFTVIHSSVSWWWIFFICVFGTILPFGLYNEGINSSFLPAQASPQLWNQSSQELSHLSFSVKQ